MAQVEPIARAGDGHVHQAALFFQAVAVAHGIFVREKALLHAGDENAIELQAFGRVHGHKLHRVLPCLGHVVASFQGGVGQESGQRRQRLAGIAKLTVGRGGLHGQRRAGRAVSAPCGLCRAARRLLASKAF